MQQIISITQANDFLQKAFQLFPAVLEAEKEFKRIEAITLPIECKCVAAVWSDFDMSVWESKYQKWSHCTPLMCIDIDVDNPEYHDNLFNSAYGLYKAEISELQRNGTLPMCKGKTVSENDISPFLSAQSAVRDAKRDIINAYEEFLGVSIYSIDKQKELIDIVTRAYNEHNKLQPHGTR